MMQSDKSQDQTYELQLTSRNYHFTLCHLLQISFRRRTVKFGASGFPDFADPGFPWSHGGGGRCGHGDGGDCLDELVVRFEEESQAEEFVRFVT